MRKRTLGADARTEKRSRGHTELADALVRGSQGLLSAIFGPRPEVTVDAVLTVPGVDRLLAHTAVAGDLGHLAAGRDQVDDSAAELLQVAAASHAAQRNAAIQSG
jgi:hypothetical protein